MQHHKRVKGCGATRLWKGDFHEETHSLVVKGPICHGSTGHGRGSAARAGSVGSVNGSPIGDQVRHELVMLPWYGCSDNLEIPGQCSEMILSGQVVSEHANTKRHQRTPVTLTA